MNNRALDVFACLTSSDHALLIVVCRSGATACDARSTSLSSKCSRVDVMAYSIARPNMYIVVVVVVVLVLACVFFFCFFFFFFFFFFFTNSMLLILSSFIHAHSERVTTRSHQPAC